MLKSISFSRESLWYVLIALLMVTFPWNERINSIFILLLVVHWLVDKNLFQKISSLKKQWKKILPFWIFFFLHLLFLNREAPFEDALQTVEVKLSFLLLPLIFSTENYFEEKTIKKIFFWFCISCFLSIIYCIITYYIYEYPLHSWQLIWNRMYFSLYIMHPGYYSNFFVIGVIFLTMELFENNKQSILKNILHVFLLVTFLFIITILVSKTAIIVVMLFCVYVVWKVLATLKHKLIKYILFALIAALGLFTFTLVPSIKGRIQETKVSFAKVDKDIKFGNSTGSRIAAWGLEWELIQSKWISGYGTGNANSVLYDKLVKEQYADLVINKMHTHNQLLHTWLDLGILGVLSLILLFTSCFYYFYKNQIIIGAWANILLFTYCLTDDALEIQSITVFCIFLITLFLCSKKPIQAVGQLIN